MSKQKITRRDFLKAAGTTVVAGAGLSGCSLFQVGPAQPQEFDILIKDGLIIDGTGKSGFTGSVGVIGDKIAAVGRLPGARAGQVIDAAHLAVAPGFINIHGHTDGTLLSSPEGMSSIMQGVTTEIGGQCGGSQGWKVGEYLDTLAEREIGINFATMVGHGTIREEVIGQSGREPTAEELQRMRAMVDEAIQSGAVGLSTGLEYTPGNFAQTPELIELARALKPYGLPYATHMRNEDRQLLEAIDEALTIGKVAQCPVQISHLKVLGRPNWHKIDRMFEMIEKASDQRGNVHYDRYPYIAYSTGLSIIFPGNSFWSDCRRQRWPKRFGMRCRSRSTNCNRGMH